MEKGKIMRVILEIDEKYANVLSVTLVGCAAFQTVVTTHAVDLSKCNHLIVDENGKFEECEERQ